MYSRSICTIFHCFCDNREQRLVLNVCIDGISTAAEFVPRIWETLRERYPDIYDKIDEDDHELYELVAGNHYKQVIKPESDTIHLSDKYTFLTFKESW